MNHLVKFKRKMDMKWFVVSLVLIVIAIVRYFYKLDAWPCFHDDEYQTFATAYGYLKTGTFYKWNFQYDAISDQMYRRAWPYTIVLANWIRIFGLSEISCRALSALLGVLTIISCIYITKKLFGDIIITCVTAIIILANSTITSLFRFTRMYSLSILLCLWFVYFAYAAMTKKNHIDDNTAKKFLIIIKRNFDFHIGYVLLALLFLYFASVVHINSLALCLGIIMFIFYKAFTAKERKWNIAAALTLAAIFLLISGVLLSGRWSEIKQIPIWGRGIGAITQHAGWFNIQIEYFKFILKEFGSELIASLLAIFYILYVVKLFIRKRKNEILDVLVYLGSITILTLLFFVLFTNRYYAARYIVMLAPISAMVYAVGLSFAFESKKILGIGIGSIFLAFCLINVKRELGSIYEKVDKSDFLPAYETISEFYNLEKDTVPIAGINIRSYYCSQVVKQYEIANLKNSNSMDTLIEFSKEYPEGILTCEYNKLVSATQGLNMLLCKWSDHLAGEGIDDYNVEVSHYYVVEGQQTVGMSDKAIDIYDLYINQKEKRVNVLVDLDSIENSAELLCVKINMESSNGDKISRIFQLKLPDDKNGIYEYKLPWDSLKNFILEDAEIADTYAVYGEGVLQEYNK